MSERVAGSRAGRRGYAWRRWRALDTAGLYESEAREHRTRPGAAVDDVERAIEVASQTRPTAIGS